MADGSSFVASLMRSILPHGYISRAESLLLPLARGLKWESARCSGAGVDQARGVAYMLVTDREGFHYRVTVEPLMPVANEAVA